MSAVSIGSGPLSPLGQQALEWARYRKVFPCWPRGKPPMIKGGFLKATQDPALVHQWWTQWPKANIGLPTGHENGIIVVDPDGKEGERLLALVEKKFGKLPPTVEIETGKGRHLIFKLPESCGRIPCSKADGLDIRADGGYVIAPPSIHENGKTYAFAKDRPGQLALAPLWLLEAARDWPRFLKALDGSTAAWGKHKELANEGRPEPRQGRDSSVVAFPVRGAVTEAWTPGGEARLRSALIAIPADNRDIWLKVGFALYDLAAADPRWPGRALWDEGSKTCPEKFDSAGQDKAWDSFARDYDGPRITVATIYHLAKEHGWRDPTAAPAECRTSGADSEKAKVAASEDLQEPQACPLAGMAGVDVNRSFRIAMMGRV
jgi:hypothetical protein